ncbi:protein kinase [Candidatus Halobeggiatoa sp. HSG11]|nr:protein kinase [Candidatus Halobeggiatoa sp. HSG11]
MHNKKHVKRCPQCGFDEHKYQQHPLHLKPRTILQNQYIIGVTIGQGGFGTTYLGLDQRLQKKVAIKEYLPSTLATRDVITANVIPLKKQESTFNKGLQLFIDEARHLAKFDHPNIVRVINFFEANQTGYMVMDYLEGLNPETIINQVGGNLPVKEALDIILPLLDALTEVHAQHIYHRDISIQNICILESGIPVLIDFGAARHVVGEQSRTLDLVLKHGYSPLEQYSGRGKIGPWTDIYACGALLYLMITGKLPPAATDRFYEDILLAPIEMEIDISQSISDAIMQALAIKHEERFQTVTEFKAALQGFVPKKIPKSKVNKKLVIFIFALTIIGSLYLSNLYFNDPVKLLFEQAQIQWKTKKILTPSEDNVYATYKQILQLEPKNIEATDGINKIADFYYELAQIENTTKSLEFIQQGLTVKPEHENLLALKQEVNGIILKKQKSEHIQQLLIKASKKQVKLDTAVAYYKQVLTLEANNKLAQDGLVKIANKYFQLARKKSSLISEGLNHFPTHGGLLKLNQELLNKKILQRQKDELNKKIKTLLNKAKLQLKNLQLTLPLNNNAFATYQQVLELEPDNVQAQVGLNKIADKYEKLANTKDLRKNLELVDKGLIVLPTHVGLIALRNKIMLDMQPKPEPKISKKVPPKVVNKPEKKIIPPSPKLPVSNIQNLLNIANQQLELAQFDLAYQIYKQVLIIEPENFLAIDGLQKVAQHYEDLVKSKYQQGKLSESLHLIDKGLAAEPSNSYLLVLQQQIVQHLEEAEKIPEKKNVILTPSF